MKFYYADTNNQPIGPFSEEQIVDFAKTGVITADTLIVGEGEKQWTKFIARFPQKARTESSQLPPIPKLVPQGNQAAELGAANAEKLRLSKEALALYKSASTEAGEFDKAALHTLPVFKFGNFFDKWSGRVQFRFGQSRDNPSIIGDTCLYVYVYYSLSESPTLFNRAHLSGGQELELTKITSKRGENAYQEYFNIAVPDDLLWEHKHKGLRIRVSRPDEGKIFVLEVAAIYIQAVLALRFPDRFDTTAETIEKHVSRTKEQEIAQANSKLSARRIFFGGLVGGAVVIAVFAVGLAVAFYGVSAPTNGSSTPSSAGAMQLARKNENVAAPGSDATQNSGYVSVTPLVRATSDQVTEMILGALSSDVARIATARSKIDALPKNPPGDRTIARSLNTIGLEQMKAGHTSEALATFIRAAQADASDAEVLNNCAWAMIQEGRHGEAALMLVETLRHAPERTNAWANLGFAYVKGGANFEDNAVGAYLLAYRFSSNQQRTRDVFSRVLNNEPDGIYKRVIRRVVDQLGS